MLDVNLIFSRPGFSLSAAFTLHAGGITVLRGDSGSGKTTLADLLSGAIAPQKGQIISDGDIWFDAASGINRPPQEREIGFVFQTHRLFPNLTVEENIRFPVLFGNRKPLLAFAELVNLLGIEKLLPRHPATLSGGESQRAALARALMGAEKLLIFDEPLASLDRLSKSAKSTARLLTFIRSELPRISP